MLATAPGGVKNDQWRRKGLQLALDLLQTRPMPGRDEISYTDVEVRSVLPLGWSFEPDTARWDEVSRIWEATVLDGSDLAWPVRVSLDEARSAGRLEALRRATQKTMRQRAD